MLTKERICKPVVIVPALVVVYFLAFPADLEVLIAPVTEVLNSVADALARVLALTSAVSPWLYILAGVFILSKTVTSIWGHKSQN
ncbi:MAG: hypothetical protein ACYSWQ_08335 [Planctomycetota bacterium]|jgi:hypothetical protein